MKLIKCDDCGEITIRFALNLCWRCYEKQYNENSRDNDTPLIECVECGKIKPHYANKLCGYCYGKKWRKENTDKMKKYYNRCKKNMKEHPIKCVECGKIKPHKAFNLCMSCYIKRFRDKNRDKIREEARKQVARRRGYGDTILMPNVFPVPSDGHHLKNRLYDDESGKIFIWYIPRMTHRYKGGCSSNDGHWTFCGDWIKKAFCMSINAFLNGTDFMCYDAWKP